MAKIIFSWIKNHISWQIPHHDIHYITKIPRMGRKRLLPVVLSEPHRMKMWEFFFTLKYLQLFLDSKFRSPTEWKCRSFFLLLNISNFSMTRNYGSVGYHLVQPFLETYDNLYKSMIICSIPASFWQRRRYPVHKLSRSNWPP